ERAAGDRAHDHRAAPVERDAGCREPVAVSRGTRGGHDGAEAGDGGHDGLHAPIAERANQAPLVPAGLGAKDRDPHAPLPAPPDGARSSRPNDRFSTPGSSRPARKTRPDARLLTTTSAGLNSMRSTL